MPAAVAPNPKIVLGDSTQAHRNANISPSHNAAKRRKLDFGSSPASKLSSHAGLRKNLGSSQPKSQFEEEVLEKLTQDISDLKRNNAEKDQKWDRPALGRYNQKTDALCFQQIEAEKGFIHGGKATVKLFGVTEVGTTHSTSIRELTSRL